MKLDLKSMRKLIDRSVDVIRNEGIQSFLRQASKKVRRREFTLTEPVNLRRINVREMLERVCFMIERIADRQTGHNVLIVGEEVAPWSAVVDDEESLEHNLRAANNSYDVRIVRRIETPRKILRPAVLEIKKLIYNEIRAALDPVLQKQVIFNASVVRCISKLCERTDVQSNLSKEQLSSVQSQLRKFSYVEQKLVQLEHAVEAIRPKHHISEPTMSVTRAKSASKRIFQLSEEDFVALTYEYLLGRAPDQQELMEAVNRLRREGDRVEFIKSVLKSPEFWQSVVPANFRPITERDVEVQWCLARIKDAQRVLDVGCAESDYLEKLSHLELHAADVRYPVVELPRNANFVKCDITKNVFRPGSLDLIICISTLEHIGLRAYGLSAFPEGDLQAMREMMNSLRSRGRLLITVPYGKRENHGWLRVYDEDSWRRLIGNEIVLEEQFFRYDDGRYVSCFATDLKDVGYIDPHSPLGRAGGLVCAEIQKQ